MSRHQFFKQGDDLIDSDSIIFNTNNKKAIIFNSRTEQSGGVLNPEITKKENDSVLFVKNAKFTTSENPDDPEYYFLIRKGKIVPGKKNCYGCN